MASIEDVAAYVLDRQGPISTEALNRLVYYSHGWSWAWDGAPLVDARLVASSDGPTSAALFARNGGRRELAASDLPRGDTVRLRPARRATVDAVLEFYGSLGAEELVALSRRERPWIEARTDLGPTERCDALLREDTIREYFGNLAGGSTGKRVPDAVRRGVRLALTVPEDELVALDDTSGAISGDEATRWLAELCPADH